MPHPFSRISFGLWEPGIKDSLLGKVSISRDDLQATPIRDEQWYRLVPVDADSEVQVLTKVDDLHFCSICLCVHVLSGQSSHCCKSG